MKKDKVRNIIKTYKLNNPLSFFKKMRILKIKSRIHARVLAADNPGLSGVSIVLRTYYSFRRFGIRLSPAASIRITYGTFAAGFAALCVAGFILVQNFVIGRGDLITHPSLAMGTASVTESSGRTLEAKGLFALSDSAKVQLDQGESVYLHASRHRAAVFGKGEFGIKRDERFTAFTLSAGMVLSKVYRLSAEERYTIQTPDAEVVVKGTLFSVKYDEGTTTVAVKEGNVEVRMKATGETKEVNEGNTLKTGTTLALRTISTEEADILVSFEKCAREQKDDGKITDPEAVQSMLGDISQKLTKKNEPANKPLTLDDIRKKYGRIDELSLYDGRTIYGAIVEKGEMFTIVTVTGTKKVRKNDIHKSRMIP